jgi:hypothetical protein
MHLQYDSLCNYRTVWNKLTSVPAGFANSQRMKFENVCAPIWSLPLNSCFLGGRVIYRRFFNISAI